MPLKSSGIIVVEKPSPASVCVSQQQQVLFATTTTSGVSSQKSVAELQYCEYYESNEQHAQQQHAVVLEQCSKNGSTQQHHLIRRQQQQQRNHASVAATATIQQFNLKQSQQQSVQHVVHHGHQQQKQQQQQQVIQVSEELYEQAAAAAGNMMISTTGEVLNQQYFKIVTPDGSTGNMIIGPMGNVTAAGAQNSSAAANNNSKVLLSNVTVLSKQAASTGAVSAQQQQPQTINFVSTKNLSYLATNTSSGGSVASAATNSGKQQKLMSSVASYKANAKQSQQQQQHIMSNTSSAAATTAYIHQAAQQQQHLVQKVTVPRNVQMVTRVQTLIQQQQQQHQQQQQQQSQMILQPQSSQQQPPQKYVVPVATKAGNVLKKQNSMKMSQQKMLSNIQSGSVKTFIQQQHQQQQQHQGNSNSQQHQSGPYQTTNKMKSQKIVKQYNNTINSSAGAVSIATLPQHNQSNQSALATYTVNHKVNNHQQQSTKITKLPNNKFLMHNNQQQQQAASVMSSNTAANLPHGTQIHHKSMQQLQHASNSNNNVIMQQQPVLTTHSNANSSTIKFVNAHGTVIHQHHQQNTAQKQQRPVQQHHKQPVQQYPQQLQFVEAPVAGDNIYQLAPTTPQQQQSPASTTSSSCSQSLISDDIMIVNGTQMTDELSARILQSMAQNSFGNQQRYQQQQQQMKCSTVTGAASSINMPPPQQIMLQHHTSNLVTAAAPNHVNLPSKEYPIYNPMQHQQQHATNYMLTSNNIVSAGASCAVSSGAASRQVQSAPGSRSHSIERKPLETSITRKSSEYFKVNNSNLVTRSCTTSASGDAQATGQSAKTITTDDDIIGEEVRPVPVSTHDVRLHVLHAVLQDHTYANPTPTRFPTEMSTASPTASQSISVVGQAQVSVSSTYGTPPTPLIPPQQWSLGGIGATVAQTGSMGTASLPLPISTLSAQTHLTPGGASSYTLYGQQIPRLQQDDDANSAISSGSRLATGDIDPGEETETAAEAEDDSVTRCICDLTHDDGYMICCDKCSAWQHVDCMGIDRQNIPDEYLCELCQPRQVDKERARALQLMKRKEQQTQLLISSHANSAANEGASSQIGSSSDGLVQQQRLGAAAGGSFLLSSGGGDTTAATRGSLAAPNSATPGGNHSTYNKKGKVLKKTKESGVANKRAKKAEKGAAAATAGCGVGGKLQRKDTKKTTKRKTKNSESSSNGNTGGTAAERHAANLRQWIENYELAVTNHYSPELRARLHAISKQPNLLQSITSTENKALKNCGRLDAKASTVPHAGAKILISNLDIPPHCPIFELRGKYMLTTQYKTQNSSINMNSPPPANYLSSLKAHKIPGPFIFFYQLPGVDLPLSNSGAVGIDGHIFSLPPPSPAAAQHLKGPEICVDTRTYGNEARFVRRSCRPNAEIQHLFEKGTIHLFIVSLIDIRASTEITIRHEPHDLLAIEHKRSSQLVIQPTSTACACGLVKDCLFGPPPQQSPTPGAVIKSTRKGITMNGSSAAALQLTMGGLPAPSTPLGKKRAQNNRNRSTSSSDSNMGLNSPNILPQSNIGSSSNNVKSLNMLSSASFISTASNTFTSSAMNDSGICTSSSSPSVSIPSPSSHIHSPTQQPQHPQHCVHPLQKQTLSAVLQQRSLLTQHEQQQQQNYAQVAALPTPILLSPHQLLEQSQPQTPTLSVVATAASAVPNVVTMPQATEPERQPEDVVEERIQEQQTIYVRLDQQNTPPEQQIMMSIHEDVVATTNALPVAPNLVSPVPLTETNQNNNTAATRQSISPSSHTSSTSNAALLKHNSSDQLEAQQPKQQKQTIRTPSPMPSPQKQSITNSTSSARKTSAKQLNSSRNTSISEDAGTGSDHQQPMDGDNTASTQSPSSSNNTTSASPKEKPKLTRDERKMEAILRAIEKMEKSTQRKQEPKQPKRVSKRRQSEAPCVAEKQSSCDDTDATKSTVTEARNIVSVKKVSAAQGGSRKKKRKSQKKSYTTQNASALRKRRQSSLNSNESAEAAESSVVADTNAVGAAAATAAGTTSESESNSLFSPSIQTMAQPPTEHNCIEQTSVEQMDNDSYNDSTPDITEADSNVDHAAGLLMAFANPNNSVMSQEEPALHAAQHSPVSYMMHDDVFKSPVRLQTTRDPNTSASPPPTPPAPVSSACLLLEAAVGPLEPMDQQTVEFKYPISTQTKTKKVLMSNWLNQSDVPAMNCLSGLPSPSQSQPPPIACGSLSLGLDSLVQAAMSDYKQQEEVENFSMVAKQVEEFIHQTEYPSPAAEQEKMCSADYLPSENYHSSAPESNPQQYASSAVRNLHLPLPVSTCSNNSSVKKRWLRQAISEETDESPLTPSSTSTPLASSPLQNNYLPLQNGFTTPLKKRRLVISSQDDGEEYVNQSVSPPLSITPTTTANRDDESEIVDVGNNNEIAGLHLTTTPSILPHATTMTPMFNHENSDLSTQMHSSSLLHVGFKPEMAMEQDDDVDIMGSPSPDSQNMVAEDNLVKIEPEDVSGNDVKIDVEREESEAFDKFEEIIQMKREAEQYTDAGDGRDETTECKDEIKDEKITGNHQSLTPKVEQKYDCFEQQRQLQCKPLLKMEDTVKQQPKLELQFGQFGSSSPKQSEEKTSLAATEVVTSVRMPAPTVQPTGSNYVGASGIVVPDEISSSSVAPMASPSAAVVSTSKTCKTASADSTSSSRNKISRKSLSDDDIQERLHSFHKENILILQSRNKKTKTSAASMSPARSSAKTDTKHSAVDSRSSTPYSRKPYQRTACSSTTKNVLRKERSNSFCKYSSSRNSYNSNLSHRSSSSHKSSTSSAAKTLKPLKKSHYSSTSNVLSSTTSSSSSMVSVVSTTTSSNARERNRCRSVSISSASSYPSTSSARKRQVNFEQELSKDTMLSNSGVSHRYRREDSTGNSYSSSCAKKRRDTISGECARFVDHRSHKHKTNTTSNCPSNNNHPYHNPENRKLYSEVVMSGTSTIDPPTTAAIVSEAKIAPTASIVMAPATPLPVGCSNSDSPSISHISQKAIPPSNALPSGLAAIAHAPAEAVVTFATPAKCTSNLPYYNTVYGKLLDNSHHQAICNPSVGSPIDVIVSNCMAPASTANGCPTMLSEYLDTKARSYNSLGGYVSHTAALFGLNTSTKAQTSELRDLHNPAVVTVPVIGTNTALELQTCTPPTAGTAAIIGMTPSLPKPLKILTKTASHDPRLNPNLTAPEPPVAPKRKLSINEYRKRKQQTTSSLILPSCATKEKSILASSALLQTAIISKYATADILGKCATITTGSNPSDKSSYVATMNKCTLNSPERSLEIIRELHQKSLNDSTPINSGLSFANVEMPRMRVTEEDTSKVQFSAAPTLLEKQQEILCERLKSLKNKQSAADLVTGRLNVIGNDFALKKDDDMLHNRITISDLDSCLEAISSTSTSMTSSRESSPERRSRPSDTKYNKTTVDAKSESSGCAEEASQNPTRASATSLNSVVAATTSEVETTSTAKS